MAHRSGGMELMSVSVIAGPDAGAVIEKLGGVTLFEPSSGSKPAEIVTQLKTIAEKGETAHLVIQCEIERPLMAYAFLFADELASVARLTSAAFAIDSATLLDLLLDRKATSLSVCLIAEQIEFASDIFLGNANGADCDLARSITLSLNPRARVGAAARIDRETTFDFEQAVNAAGWRSLLDGEPSRSGGKVTAFACCARRPFHPERFSSLLQKGLAGVFRAKGFFWLATRMDDVGGLNLAGSELQCASAGHWWATRDPQTRECEMPERTRKQWQEPFGDRRQSFAILAFGVDRDALQHQLEECLLTDQEMALGEEVWCNFPDPFPLWGAHSHSHAHQCDHDHGSHEHDCCG